MLLQNSSLPFTGVVHHGLDFSSVPVAKEKGDFFLFMGRASPEKGADVAARIALLAGVKLVMVLRRRLAAEKHFFLNAIAPLVQRSNGQLIVLDEADTAEKYKLLGRARGVIFTSIWEEPFGLVMIEAMASGTPVLAFRRGSAPEVIVNGVTGFLADTDLDLTRAIRRVDEIDPLMCRSHVDRSFSIDNMISEYERLYRRIVRNDN